MTRRSRIGFAAIIVTLPISGYVTDKNYIVCKIIEYDGVCHLPYRPHTYRNPAAEFIKSL